MASVTIRNLPDDVKERLRVRAAQRGNSLEQELRNVITSSVNPVETDGVPFVNSYAHLAPDKNGLLWPFGPDGFPVAAVGVTMPDPHYTFRREDEYGDDGR
jgi:plasmid stability protein